MKEEECRYMLQSHILKGKKIVPPQDLYYNQATMQSMLLSCVKQAYAECGLV